MMVIKWETTGKTYLAMNNEAFVLCVVARWQWQCGAQETMEHILIICNAPGQKEVWEIASELWMKKTQQHLRPSFNEVMSCGLYTSRNQDGKIQRGETRLYQIIVSESAHLIWKLRNDRVINEKNPASQQEIRNRWVHAMNTRLAMDCLTSNREKYGTKALKKPLILSTWHKVLLNEDMLPKDWTRETGVLVGIGT